MREIILSLTINYKGPLPTAHECIELWQTATHLEECPIKLPRDRMLAGGGSDFRGTRYYCVYCDDKSTSTSVSTTGRA